MKLIKPEQLSLHPDADLIPQMSHDQWTQFLDDIKQRGIKSAR